MKIGFFTRKIVEWYGEHHRNLPWRNTQDPYKIWLSEIILQQTRVLQGLPYFKKFIRKYPNIKSLARAPEAEILRLWQGLGYYTRARNLHACAKLVVKKYRGEFPSSFEELRALPGVGDYTAAAIASFAFKKQIAVVDGNVYRVLARVFGIHMNTATREGKKYFFDLANDQVPVSSPDVHNQAIMEFGALHCLPQNPLCETCVLKAGCFAYQHGQQGVLPAKTKKKKPTARYFVYFILWKDGKILMTKRNGNDIWRGLYDFPLIETKKAIGIAQINKLFRLASSRKRNLRELNISKEYKHVLTHQIIHARFVELPETGLKDLPQTLDVAKAQAYSLKRISRLPKPVLILRYLEGHLI